MIVQSNNLVHACSACKDGQELAFPITMAFQPIVNCVTRTVYSYEALVRGVHGESAQSVLAQVNESNRYQFDQACRVKAISLAASLGLTAEGARLSINFMPGAVYSPEACIRKTLATARQHNFPLHRLTFEITEDERVSDVPHLRSIVQGYRRHGFSIAMDDFGAGYSGLNLLAQLNPNKLKLDGTLIRGVDSNPAAQKVVRHMVELAADLNISIVAECVETVAEAQSLLRCGIWLMQGFLFAKPEVEALPQVCWPDLDFSEMRRIGRADHGLDFAPQVRSPDRGEADRREMERYLKERTALFTAFMEHSPAIGFIKDEKGRFLYYNRLFCERYNVSGSEWINKSVFDLFPRDFAAAYHADDMEVLASLTPKLIEESSPGPAGMMYWRTHKFPILVEGSRVLLGALCLDLRAEVETVERLRREHEEIAELNLQLSELSNTDELTGLYNRRAFDKRLQEELDRSCQVAVALLDLDNFKSVNDTFGHPSGDTVLITVGELLRKACRDRDCVARYGGEEFAILLAEIAEHRILEAAERLRRVIEQYQWALTPITVSIGVTFCSAKAKVVGKQLLGVADQALYRAKGAGRNRVCLL